MARVTLEQLLAAFPDRVADLRTYLDTIVTTISDAGDLEAAGLEVEDAHREALTKITEAERRANVAERGTRLAEERAADAQRERQDAEAIADDALAEASREREQSVAEIQRCRTEADAAITEMRGQLAAALAVHARELADRDAAVSQAQGVADAARLEAAALSAAKATADDALSREIETNSQLRIQIDEARRHAEEARQHLQERLDTVERARQQGLDDLTAVRVELATVSAQAVAARQAAQHEADLHATTRRDLSVLRTEMNAERDALRAAHTEQIAQLQHNADQRVEALTKSLQALQREPGSSRPPGRSSKKSSPKSTPGTTRQQQQAQPADGEI